MIHNCAVLVGITWAGHHQYLELHAEAERELLQGGDGHLRPQLPLAASGEGEVGRLPPQTEPGA